MRSTWAEAFCKVLVKAGCNAECYEIAKRNHISILWNAINDTDPVTQAMLSFVMAQVEIDDLARTGPRAVDDFGTYLARYIAYVAQATGREVSVGPPLASQFRTDYLPWALRRRASWDFLRAALLG